MWQRNTKGFSFVEVLVVVAVIVVIAAVLTVALQNFNTAAAKRVAKQELYSALVDARARTLASEGDTVHGVHIGTTSVVRFIGSSFDPLDSNNEEYVYERGVNATGSLAVAGTDIIFARLTGEPSATGTVIVQNASETSSSTVTIHESGLIEF